MASQTYTSQIKVSQASISFDASMKPSDINAQNSGKEMSSELLSTDLPSTRLLGKGLAGIGYETRWKGARYARKDFFGVPSETFLKEAPLLVGLGDHKNIVKTYGWTTDKRSCSLVLEYMDDDLVSLLLKKRNSNKVLSKQSNPTPPFDLPEALDMMVQIAMGVAFLHGRGIAHGDLKTKNILVSRVKGGQLSSIVVKVADFGLVRTKRNSEFIVSRQVRKLDMVRWKAPECWSMQFTRQLNTNDETSSDSDSESSPSETPSVANTVDESAADVYSFAMICTQLLTGNTPFPHMNWKDLGHKILGGLKPNLPNTCHPLLKDLLMSCWGGNPAKRPSFAIICSELTSIQQSIATGPTSSMEPTQVSNALEIIEDVQYDPSQFESERAELLTNDAEKDKEALNGLSAELSSPRSLSATKSLLELPSYLMIPRDSIAIYGAVKAVGPDKSASVKYGKWLNCDFAVKVWRTYHFDEMLKEVRVLMELRHPHIVLFIGFSEGVDPDSYALLMEMMPALDLRHYMKNRPLESSQKLDIITQIAKGMLYLHTQGYVHGSLECSNILVREHTDYIEVKIGGFRHAEKLMSAGGSSLRKESRRLIMKMVPRSRTPLDVTWNYPDDLRRQKDVFSFASTCYEIITGKEITTPERPFDGTQEQDTLKEKIKGLIKSCWASDPSKRPRFEEICVILESISSPKPSFIKGAFKKVENTMKKPFRSDAKVGITRTPGPRESGGDANDLIIPDDLKSLKIKPETLGKVCEVGRGTSGEVYTATWLRCACAVKRFHISADAASKRLMEFYLLFQLRHPYIIQLVGFSIDKDECLLVMEFMKGSLRELIDSRVKKSSTPWMTSTFVKVMLPFDFDEEVSIITKLALGMYYLHSKGVVHRNLKAQNVLCQAHGGSYIEVKIVDFGVSRFIDDAGGMVGAGTGYWRAPEILPRTANPSRKYSVDWKAADVYSFAMTCYEIITGLHPFKLEFGSELSHDDEVVSGMRPELPSAMNAVLKHLIIDCWQADPDLRPDFSEICTRLTPHKCPFPCFMWREL